jgi:hypothetical protein
MLELREHLPNRLVVYQDHSDEPMSIEDSLLTCFGVSAFLVCLHQSKTGNAISVILLVYFITPIVMYIAWRRSACVQCIFDKEQDTLVKGLTSLVLPTMQPKIYFLTDIVGVELVFQGVHYPKYFIQLKNRWNQAIKLNINGRIKESEAKRVAESVSRFLKFSYYNEVSPRQKVSRRINVSQSNS